MNHELIHSAEKYAKKRRGKKAWKKVVGVLGCVVVFCTSYALILPAITMSREAFCGYEEHQHTDKCYGAMTIIEPVCTAEHLGIHVHGEGCYGEDGTLVCGQCDYVLHTHDERCYLEDGSCWCPLPERTAHVHTDECYSEVEVTRMEATAYPHSHSDACLGQVKGELLCTIAEAEGHTHGEGCYEHQRGELTCTAAETAGHTHGEGCYEQQRGELTCTAAETSGHTHGESCYTLQQGELTCTAEGEDHVHGDGCYAWNKVLTCTSEECAPHSHSDSCYAWNNVLVCTTEECAAHSHGDECYAWNDVLTCTAEETEGHTHTDACWAWSEGFTCGLSEGDMVKGEPVETVSIEKKLTCSYPEETAHSHGDECFITVEVAAESTEPLCGLPVHDHKLICFSNPEADVESRSDWEATLPVELSGNAADDMMSIAVSQLGYHESERNYTVLEDGETMLGYSRYGDWYGVPYGDWCAMFVSFCLHYADVEGMPLHSAVRPWIDELNDLELYHDAEGYLPQRGDVIFFDWEVDGKADHVGLVAEVIEAEGNTPAKIKTIEGNSGDCVQYVTYNLSDKRIFGYSSLPESKEIIHYLCLTEAHTHEDTCYAEDGTLLCTLSEHVHDETCMVRTVFYTDHSIRAFAEISGVDELPADLLLELWQVNAENEPATYAAMQSALGDKMSDSPHFIGAASFYQMRLVSEGQEYTLPETAQVKVNVEFTESLFTPEELAKAVEAQAFTLTPDETAAPAEDEPQVIVEEEGSATATLSAKTYAAGTEEGGSAYQADAIDETTGDDEITGLSYTSNGLMPFAVMLTSTVQEGTFWTRVDSTAEITNGGTYMIVSAEGNYALRGNSNTNYQAVTISAVKGNEEYYTISDSDNALLRWTISRNNNYTIQCQGGNQRYLRLSNTTFVSSSSGTNSMSYHNAEHCWRIYSGNYYLRNEGGAFSRSNGNDGTHSGYGVTTTLYPSRDMLIFKLSDVTELEIPDDVSDDGTEGGSNAADAPDKPDYGEFIEPSEQLSGNTALTKDDVTVEGQYYSDPSTSNIEGDFRYDGFDTITPMSQLTEKTYAQHKSWDGKVKTDKSVIYGKDDYNAFSSYDPNTFSVTLSALGQAYEMPQTDLVKTPVDVVFILDVSGSMATDATSTTNGNDGRDKSRAAAVVAAANQSIKEIMDNHPANRIGIALYSSGAWEMLPLDRYTATETDANGYPEYLVCKDQQITHQPTNYKPTVRRILGGDTLKNTAGKSFANAGNNAVQGIGTYQQAGIAVGNDLFEAIGTDTTWTTTIGEGMYEREYTVKRQPVFILLSDGEPTHSTNNYMDPLSGPHYGNGNGGSANAQGIHGYNTILSANYFKRLVGIQYDRPALFYTIGMGINTPDEGDGPQVSGSDTGDNYKRAVLNPTYADIAKLTSGTNAATTTTQLKNLLNNNYNSDYVTVSYNWPDNWMGVPHENIPALQPNPYAGSYSYADGAYFGKLSENDLAEIFSSILHDSLKVIPYGFILYQRSSVDVYDQIGAGMQMEGDPILRYNGVNYTHTAKSEPTVNENGDTVISYTYDYTFDDPYIPDKTYNLREIKVELILRADGSQDVDFFVPDTALPTYMPQLIGIDLDDPDYSQPQYYYYEVLPVRLIFQVGLTEESEAEVMALQRTGGTLTFYTNRWDADNIVTSTLLPSDENPFYFDQYNDDGSLKSTAKYHEHSIAKKENTTETLSHVVDCYEHQATVTIPPKEEGGQPTVTTTEQVIHDLGNNGKLVFTATPSDIPVEKNWIGFAESEQTEIDVTLYLVTENEAPDGTVSYSAAPLDSAKLNAASQWKHSFQSPSPAEENQFLAIAETVPTGCQVKYSGETIIIPGADGAPVKAAKVDFTTPDGVLVTITNSPGVVLPNTGGEGTTMFILTGLTLMFVSAALLLCSTRRRREAR